MTNNKYQNAKEKAREKAIDWQSSVAENNYSYGELIKAAEYFTKLGKKYGLLKEFRENGIC